MENYYDILQVKRTATPEEIKAAYLSLSKLVHPDKNPHASEAEKKVANEKMASINVAYATLRDSLKKSDYDSLLKMEDVLHYRPDPTPPPPQKPNGSWAEAAQDSERVASRVDEILHGAHRRNVEDEAVKTRQRTAAAVKNPMREAEYQRTRRQAKNQSFYEQVRLDTERVVQRVIALHPELRSYKIASVFGAVVVNLVSLLVTGWGLNTQIPLLFFLGGYLGIAFLTISLLGKVFNLPTGLFSRDIIQYSGLRIGIALLLTSVGSDLLVMFGLQSEIAQFLAVLVFYPYTFSLLSSLLKNYSLNYLLERDQDYISIQQSVKGYVP